MKEISWLRSTRWTGRARMVTLFSGKLLIKFTLGVITLSIAAASTVSTAKAAGGLFAGGIGGVVAFSGTAYINCKLFTTSNNCGKIALVFDPPAPGITQLSAEIAFNTSEFTFNPIESGFLCQFSQNGDCPPPGGPPGTFPLAQLPDSGFNPGQPLPGSSFSLDEAEGTVFLNYVLASPVTVETDTNFFLFTFDFNNPPLIDLDQSTVTYSATDPGLDFTHFSSSCQLTALDQPCGSNNPIKGITLNLAVVPEPSTWVLLTTAFIGLLGYRWKWWVMTSRQRL